MGWPFSKRSAPNLTPEVEAIFDRLRKFLSDETAQVAQYPASLKALIAAGSDADQTPDGFGYFGTSPTNPIPVNGPIGEVLYLSSLRVKGKRLLFHRLKSIDKLDVFECVAIDGTRWDILYLDMYHPRKSRRAPDGYALHSENALLSGVSIKVPDFPHLLYSSIVAYSEQRFGMSLADPEVRMALETIKFDRSESHTGKLGKVSKGHAPNAAHEVVNELVAAATGVQIKIFNQLKKLSELEKPLDQSKIIPEIVYFVLALTTHMLFLSRRFGDPSPIADKVSLEVLRLNLESGGIQSDLAAAIKEYQSRFLFYRDKVAKLTEDQFGFGLIVSKAIYGKESPVIGAVLCAIAATVLSETKKIIEE